MAGGLCMRRDGAVRPAGTGRADGGPAPAVVSAPLPDVGSMASRVLACTACHGPEGRATPSGYFPRIAGKPAGYLYRQLKNFQQGAAAIRQ
ncbi:c-type cytochrome [Delftia tsuruhatensis]